MVTILARRIRAVAPALVFTVPCAGLAMAIGAPDHVILIGVMALGLIAPGLLLKGKHASVSTPAGNRVNLHESVTKSALEDQGALIARLVQQTKAGDQEAASELFGIVEPEARRLASRVVSLDTAQELVNQAWAKIVTADFPIFNERNFSSFFVRTVWNMAVCRLSESDDQRTKHAEATWAETRAFLCSFPEGQILLGKLRESSIHELGKEFGMSQHQIHQALQVARDRLARYLLGPDDAPLVLGSNLDQSDLDIARLL